MLEWSGLTEIGVKFVSFTPVCVSAEHLMDRYENIRSYVGEIPMDLFPLMRNYPVPPSPFDADLGIVCRGCPCL